MRALVWMVALVTFLAVAVEADVLVLKDGRTLKGSLVSQDQINVVFAVQGDGFSIRQSFRADQVDRVELAVSAATQGASSMPATASSAASGTYYVIPIRGEIGANSEVRAEWIKEMLGDARSRKVDAIVLDIDSPGGEVAETTKIVELLSAVNWAPTIALVKNGGSAAAVISVACKHIYMVEGGVIGSALMIHSKVDVRNGGSAGGIAGLGQDVQQMGNIYIVTTEQVSEKYQSYWRAHCRALAEANGHPPLLIEGMIDAALELSVVNKDGMSAVVEGTGGTVIKHSGQILALTSSEAVDYGLAEAVVADSDALGERFQRPGWVKCNSGEAIYKRHVANIVGGRQRCEFLIKDFVDIAHRLEQTKSASAAVPQLSRMLQDINELKRLASMCPFLHLNEKVIDDVARQVGAVYQQARNASGG